MRTLRALGAVGLLAGFYLVTVGIVGGLLAAAGWAVWDSPDRVSAALLAVALLIAAAVGRAFWLVINASPGTGQERGALPLTEADQPVLWRAVREIAAAAHTRPPDEIRLCADVTAGVIEKATLLGLRGGPRTLYVGAPLMVGLDAEQLRSVLAHELGHYSDAHTRLGGLIYRGGQQLEYVIAHLDGHAVVRTLFKGYRALYMTVSAPVRRQQEVEADAASAVHVGRGPAISALRELVVIDAVWSHYLQKYLAWAFDAGVRPAEIFEGLAEVLRDPARAKSLAEIRSSDQDVERSAYDSHPPISQRIAALALYPELARDKDPRSALTLLVKPDATLRALVLKAFRPALLALPVMPWRAVAQRAGHEAARRGADALQSAADVLLEAPATLAEVLQLYEAEELGSLGNAISGGKLAEGSQEARETAVEALASYVAALAVGAGTARWELSWSGPARLVGQGGEPVDLLTAARALLRPGARPLALRALVTGLGLSASARYVGLPVAEPAFGAAFDPGPAADSSPLAALDEAVPAVPGPAAPASSNPAAPAAGGRANGTPGGAAGGTSGPSTGGQATTGAVA